MKTQFDYIVVGGGTAGAVVAARLAEQTGVHVALFEAGPSDEGDEAILTLRNWPKLLRTPLDFDYLIEPQLRGNGRIRHARGKMLGGCSSHNSCIAFWPPEADLRTWEAAGAAGWGPAAVRPFLQRVQEKVSLEFPDPINALGQAFWAAAQDAGYPVRNFAEDINQPGVGWFMLNKRGELRHSSSVAYLHPLAQWDGRIHFYTNCFVSQILLNGRRAVGVQTPDGPVFAEREIILCCGAFDTPKLLMLSGIGPGEHLQAMGIEVQHHLPGVGQNLLDHPEGVVNWEATRPVPQETTQLWELGLFAFTQPGLDAPDLMFHFGTEPFDMNTASEGYPTTTNGFALTPNVARAKSQGTVRLRSANPADPQTGLVADMVRQFADVHAFVRELVQNGIDAGATALEVAVDRGGDGMAAVRVTDDGCGMTMSIVEDALLVLFRSTKDEDATKIGKYGVGFMSVFAIEPTEVTVDTWRDGDALRARLFPDHTYEIAHDAPREGSGTTVTLHKPVSAEDFDAFWMKVAASLQRWCRHAAVPIQLLVLDASSGRAARSARVDTPFDVRSLISARQRFDDMEIVVGPVHGSAALPETGTIEDQPTTFAGFYNRGLLLHETSEELRPGLADIRVKVNSPRLRHTLSRDDVRRDEPFLVALKRAERMVQVDLRAAVIREIAREAAAVGALPDDDLRVERVQRLDALCDLATKRPLSLGRRDVALPLAHSVEGASTMDLERMAELADDRLDDWTASEILTTSSRTELTAALAARGVPVLLAVRPELFAAALRLAGTEYRLLNAGSVLVHAREIVGKESLPGDDALCAWLSDALGQFGLSRVAIGRLGGGDARLGAIVPDPAKGAREHLVRVARSSFAGKWPKGSLLVLNEDAEAVACARRATSPSIGAHLLARYLLLVGPGLPSKTSFALALRALTEIR